MRSTCLICRHEKRDKIDLELVAQKKSIREIASLFGLSRSSLDRHNRHHLKLDTAAKDQAIARQERDTPRHVSANLLDPWERQPGESRPAFAAFEKYLALSTADPSKETTYEEVAQAVGKSLSMIKRWGHTSRNGLKWRARRDAWLANIDKARTARLLHDATQARERWRASGKLMQNLGLQRLMSVAPEELEAGEARHLVVDGSGLESRGLGLDRDRASVSIQNQQQVVVNIDPRAAENAMRIWLERQERKKEEELRTFTPPTNPI
jgi:DNA-binding CsgD family transcriptional regulator